MSKAKELKGIKLKDNRILIEKFKAEEKIGSIIMAEKDQVVPEGGVIVSIGPGNVDANSGLLTPNRCKVGEKVRYMEHGMEVEIEGETYYLLRDTDVWGEIA